MLSLINTFAALINLNHPDQYFHWSIFVISLANLIVILVMVVIFGLAIILPFPKGKIVPPKIEHKLSKKSDDPNRKMLTYKLRHFITKRLTLENLIPDQQPAYVSSWIYVFGVATLAALAVVILSGLVLAIGGVNWWHESVLGHFVNSVHLWGVELFMAFMVIHLWGKFWMSAWRGRRVLTWMSGVLAFLFSILEAFTGYLSQQNFDSQWISTNGKDAINATGLGSFFNLMNFGQMITWHIVIIPLILVGVIALHILFVRLKGVVPPVTKIKPTKELKAQLKRYEKTKWRGSNRQYDIIKEGAIATLIVLVLILSLAFSLSSPDDPPVTIQTWSKLAPADFVGTVVSELQGTSETAQYGPPYNHGTKNVQKIIVSWQLLVGVHQKINPAQTFVLKPLTVLGQNNPKLLQAINIYQQASLKQKNVWLEKYEDSLSKLSFKKNIPTLPKGNYGPLPTIVDNEFIFAQSGALDANLIAQAPFYGSNYTKPLLFIEDGNYFTQVAKANHLYGTQWGVMNETGSYPGQPWLWLYDLWYQIPGFSTSASVDLIAIYLTGLGTALLLFVPFIPGLRDIPRIVPVYKLIWRKWYKTKKK